MSSKRFMVVGCSHGIYQNDEAIDEVLKFQKDFDPHITGHLGDWIDTQCFMKGGSIIGDIRYSIGEDFAMGMKFLNKLDPDIVWVGNHEDRVYKLQHSKSDMVSGLAGTIVKDIAKLMKSLGAKLVPYSGTLSGEGWIEMGDAIFGHGVMFNENAARDHAEHFGQTTVIAHTHKLMRQPGRHIKPIKGFSAGCLCDIASMGYAKGRRATGAWDYGFAYGEIIGGHTWVTLREIPVKRPKIRKLA